MFVILVHMSVIYVDNISHFVLSVCFWRTALPEIFLNKFFISKKKPFFTKKSTKIFKIEYKFNCGIAGLRKAGKMSMTMLVLVAQARQQSMKTLKQWRKWFYIIVESIIKRLLMMLAYRSADVKQFFTDVLGMKRATAKIASKLLNYEQKQCSMDIA